MLSVGHRSYAVEGKEPKSTPSFFFFFEKKQYKEIRLSDETKQPPTVPTIFDGRTGDPFEQPVIIGKPYILKFIHQVDDPSTRL
ncbi:DNA-directed RNA polymerase subunit beta [Cardamine amara subsp. amara]|uniref:DNA-directed RNA polymerase n=1 Tax=Cardamine amara subsp. amara TaxID=228776 RepID=A0ABD0ZWF8_CARAN